MLFNLQTAKIAQLFTEFKMISTKLASSSSASASSTTTKANKETPSHLLNSNNKNNNNNNSNDLKQLNTTVLAGIISGIGLVIVLINLVVLFMCRRNLKHFLKTSSSTSSSTSSAASTSSSASSSSSLSLSKTLKVNPHHQHLNRDDLIQEYFDAFSTMHANANKKSLKILEMGAASSPNGGALLNTLHRCYNPEQDLLLKRQLLQHLHQQQELHQYDKMNHQANHDSNNNNNNNSSDAQNQQHYAHTYECLDSMDMVQSMATNIVNTTGKRGGGIRLGVSGQRRGTSQRGGFRTDASLENNNNNNSSHNVTNLTDIANFNVSSSSGSSSSGVSSTHHFLASKPAHQGQSALNLLLNSTASNSKLAPNNVHNNSQQFLQFNGDFVNVSNIGNCHGAGTWSPDSAYYSAIPNLTNYTNFNLQLQQQQQQQLSNPQQFVNSHQSMSNSFVDAGYNSHLV